MEHIMAEQSRSSLRAASSAGNGSSSRAKNVEFTPTHLDSGSRPDGAYAPNNQGSEAPANPADQVRMDNARWLSKTIQSGKPLVFVSKDQLADIRDESKGDWEKAVKLLTEQYYNGKAPVKGEKDYSDYKRYCGELHSLMSKGQSAANDDDFAPTDNLVPPVAGVAAVGVAGMTGRSIKNRFSRKHGHYSRLRIAKGKAEPKTRRVRRRTKNGVVIEEKPVKPSRIGRLIKGTGMAWGGYAAIRGLAVGGLSYVWGKASAGQALQRGLTAFGNGLVPPEAREQFAQGNIGAGLMELPPAQMVRGLYDFGKSMITDPVGTINGIKQTVSFVKKTAVAMSNNREFAEDLLTREGAIAAGNTELQHESERRLMADAMHDSRAKDVMQDYMEGSAFGALPPSAVAQSSQTPNPNQDDNESYVQAGYLPAPEAT